MSEYKLIKSLSTVIAIAIAQMASTALNFKVKIGEVVYDLTANSSNDKISDLKQQLTVLLDSDLPRENQRWIYQGKILNDSQTLSECNVKEGHTIIVIKSHAKSVISNSLPKPADVMPATQQVSTSRSNIASPSSTPVSTTSSSSPVISTPVPMNRNQSKLDTAMSKLFLNSVDDIKAALVVILKILGNIIANPSVEKYRKLSRQNAAFKKKVGDLSGGNECMIALGFQLQGDDWLLIPSAEAWENIVNCQTILEKFSKRLEQADLSRLTTSPDQLKSPDTSIVSEKSNDDSTAINQILISLAATVLPEIDSNLDGNTKAEKDDDES